jgi:site-specific DNA-cytosine methylase
MRTAVVFKMCHTGLADWLIQHFGQLAHGKTIPAWVLTMPPDWQRALLDGYLSADGHWVADRGKHMATTVSKRLAIGIKLLAEGLGYRVALHKYPQHSNKIEGRIFGGRDLYELAWLEDRQRQYNHEAGGHSYGRVRSIKTGHQAVTVYNLSVEEDESFVADGIVVHNCTFHSNAAGDRPVNDQSRMSAFAVLDWLEKLYVDSFIIENVPEFRMWGPLNADGGRNKRRKGEIFRKYISMIEALGYEVQYRVLKAADYGDPTSRERLFILGRRDGRPVVWPEPTHAHPKQLAAMQRQSSLFRGATLKPYRTAAEIIDWTDRGTSIFNRDRPLSPNTMRRIWIGLKKYGLKDVLAGNALIAEPFLVKLRNHGGALSVAEPVDTLCASGNHFGVVQLGSFLVGAGGPTGTARPRSVAEPVKTVLGENRIGVVQSFMMGVGGPAGQRRPRDIDEPTPTLTGTNSFAVVHPFILGQQSGGAPRPTSEPAPTIATDGAISLVQSFVMNVRGGDDGYFRGGSVDEPLGAVTTHPAMSLVQVDPFMMAIDQTGSRSGQVRGVDGVVGTLTAKNRMAVASAEAGLQPYPDGWRPDLASGESCWQPFLIRYNGTGIGADLGEPLGALTTKERYALCLPVTRGYLLVDVYFRMFKPVEMARAHSYPASFAFVNAAGKPASNQDATKMIGNSWPIDMGAALVVVQLAPRARMSAASATARMLMRGPALVA